MISYRSCGYVCTLYAYDRPQLLILSICVKHSNKLCYFPNTLTLIKGNKNIQEKNNARFGSWNPRQFERMMKVP